MTLAVDTTYRDSLSTQSFGDNRRKLLKPMVGATFDSITLKRTDKSFASDQELREWVYATHKEEIMAAMSLYDEESALRNSDSNRRLQLLDTITRVQRQFFQCETSNVVFARLLEILLELMESEYGFIGEVKYEDDGTMYLQTHASTNIAWNEETRRFYEENAAAGLKFYNLNTLFGTVLTSKKPVISNRPKQDPRAGGIPKGHPPLDHFLGIPFFNQSGAVIGMVGIANKPAGYNQGDIEFLEPFVVTCTNLIQAYWQVRRNQDLINTLEEKVKERTQKLQLSNGRLEEANRRVTKASAAQLKHFACMSHEIRTPMNCIVGLSSLLQESPLDQMQQEAIKMIVTSGGLLLKVVNDVLDYSKLESGNVQIDMKRSSLQDTLNAVVHSIEMKCQSESKAISIQTSFDSSLPEFIHVDAHRLQQILYNLLGNAVKFSQCGGVIRLLAELVTVTETESCKPTKCPVGNINRESETCPIPHQTKSHLEGGDASQCPFLRSKKTESIHSGHDFSEGASPTSLVDHLSQSQQPKVRMIRFVVKDFGKGIDTNDFERIFEPFRQASAETERMHGGTGLGLAITAKLVAALGGKISVDSEKGEWSEFTVDLPFLGVPVDVEQMSKELEQTTLLLVDDCGEKEAAEMERVFDAFGLDHVHHRTMTELVTSSLQQGALSQDRAYLCLVQEDSYDETSYAQLKRACSAGLLSFGPKYGVSQSLYHFRSLPNVMPSVLMASFIESGIAVRSKGRVVRPLPAPIISTVRFPELRVLIAEDNLINQKVLGRMLSRLGTQQVDIADNGKQAVEMEACRDYDVVLMDMHMPVMDGLEACRRIVARRANRTVPKVVFVTAHASASFEEQCAQAGGSGFVPKPFKLREIENCLQQLTVHDGQ